MHRKMIHSMIHTCNIRPALRALGVIALVPAQLALGACASDQLSLGAGDAPPQTESTTCGLSPDGIIGRNIRVTQQEQIDELAGCEEIVGDLRIVVSDEPELGPGPHLDLRPLASLRVVHGQLTVQTDNLEGLESLEQVGALNIVGYTGEDLLPLSGLTRIGARLPSLTGGGRIYLEGCNNLKDLTGLEGVQTWTGLTVGGSSSFESLEGLAMPPNEVLVVMDDLPALQSLSALSGASISHLRVTRTGLPSFDGLWVDTIGSLYLQYNPALTDLDGLSGLRALAELTLEGNDALDHLPEWPGLSGLLEVKIFNNAELRAIPAFDVRETNGSFATGPMLGADNPDQVFEAFLMFAVGGNPQLTSIDWPRGFRRGQYVGIFANPSLKELDLEGLERVDALSIRDNPLLSHVDVDGVERAGDLAVENNPALSVAGFASLQTFTSTISGNADALEAPAPE
jgi:hypothetical protein